MSITKTIKMENKTNQFFRQKQIIAKKQGCKILPCISLTGYDVLNSEFKIHDKVVITYEPNKIIIQKAFDRRKVEVFNEMKHENPALQELVDRLGLVLI